MNRALWALVLLLLGVATPAAAEDRAFADMVANEFRNALPGYVVTVADPLTLKLGKASQPGEQPLQVNLDRVVDFCGRAPAGCGQELSDFVAKIVGVIGAQDTKPSLAALRAVVRPATYVEQLTSGMKEKAGALVSAPLAGDVVMICYLDMPTAMAPVFEKDLAKIAISRDQALRTCRTNTRAGLPSLPHTPPSGGEPGAGTIGVLSGDPYESSYLILHDDWAPLARALGGRLLVAVPAADQILYTEDAGPAARDALSTLTLKAYGEADRAISKTVFRWTPTGWDVVTP